MTMPKPSRSMKTTKKTIIKADFPERPSGEGGDAGEIGCVWNEESGAVCCVWMEGSGIVDIPADRVVHGREGILRFYTSAEDGWQDTRRAATVRERSSSPRPDGRGSVRPHRGTAHPHHRCLIGADGNGRRAPERVAACGRDAARSGSHLQGAATCWSRRRYHRGRDRGRNRSRAAAPALPRR